MSCYEIKADATASEGREYYVPLSQLQAERRRVEELERLLSLALPVARAAIRLADDAVARDVSPTVEGWSCDDLVRAVSRLSPEARAEILGGGGK